MGKNIFPHVRFKDSDWPGGPLALFALYEGRIAKVVIDHRVDSDDLGTMVLGLIATEHIEVGTVGASDDYMVQIGSPNYESNSLPLTQGNRRSAIRPLSNLEDYAVAQAAVHGVDAAKLADGLILAKAAEWWNADLFISTDPALVAAAGQYLRQVRTVTPLDAARLLALLLRTKGECYLNGDANDIGRLPPWLFYRVGALALIPEVKEWRSRLPPMPGGSGDYAGLNLYDNPLDGIVGRLARALRARDRVLSTMLGMKGNESHEVVLYEVESLALQLCGALDVAATVISYQLNLRTKNGQEIKGHSRKLHHPFFKEAVQRQQPDIAGVTLDLWSNVSKMLGLIRNQIHTAPPTSVVTATNDEIWLVLPGEDQTQFNSYANKLSGTAAWGTKTNTGHDISLVDPWTLTETATNTVREILRNIAATFLGKLPDSVVHIPERWPGDQATAHSTLQLLALQPPKLEFNQ